MGRGEEKSMKNRVLISKLIVCISMLCVLAGCQLTPEKPAVVNKNNGKLEEKMFEPAAAAKAIEVPSHWNETAGGDLFDICIDTDVTVPDVSEYPVVKLEHTQFTQEQVNRFVRYFAGDAKLFLPRVKTKADYDEDIVQAKMGMEVDGEFVVTEDSEAWVKELESMRENAPDNSPVVYTDTTLTYDRNEFGKDIIETGKNFLSVNFENAEGTEGAIWVSNNLEGYSRASTLYYNANPEVGYIAESEYLLEQSIGSVEENHSMDGLAAIYDKVSLSEQEAQARALQAISDLGINDLALISADRAASLEVPDKPGYQLVFARQSGGIPVYSIDEHNSTEEALPLYAPPFEEESLTMIVTEDGIKQFSWRGYAKAVNTVTQNVELLPFEEIKQALKDQIVYKKSFDHLDESYGKSNYAVSVNSAALRMGYIGVKDNIAQAYMVPVWVFETTCEYDNAVLNKHEKLPDHTYVFNAIDGGAIERN